MVADNTIVSSLKLGLTVSNNVRVFMSDDGLGTEAWRTVFQGVLVGGAVELDFDSLRIPRGLTLYVETAAVGQVDVVVEGTIIRK